MPRSPSRKVRMLCVVATTGATVFAAAPASAAPAHGPQAKLTADQIVKRANADLRASSSYQIHSSSRAAGLTVSVSLTITTQGCLDTINVGRGISEKILVIGTSVWIQPSNDFWMSLGYTGTVLAYLEGKWVTAAAFLKLFWISNPPSRGGSCNTSSPTGIPVTGWTLVRTVKVSGRVEWRLINKHNKLGAYVSATPMPEFLRLTELGINEYLSHYNAPIMLAPPLNTYLLNTLPPPPPAGGISVRANTGSRAAITARAGLLTLSRPLNS
jgi:hypothetical protein